MYRSAMEDESNKNVLDNWWEMCVDGASRAKGCGGGAVITSPEGFKVYYSIHFDFKVTNNEAKYEALIAGLKYAKVLGVDRLKVRSDSQLVVGQVNGTAEAKEERMKAYKELIEEQIEKFEQVVLDQVSRIENAQTYVLSKLENAALDDRAQLILAHIQQFAHRETLPTPAAKVLRVEAISYAVLSWVMDMTNYMKDGSLPADKNLAYNAKMHPEEGPHVRVGRWTIVQKEFRGTIPKVSLARSCGCGNGRNSPRNLFEPSRSENSCKKNHLAMVLLANHSA
ncbi:unnamed protein product [Cuscuta europaea]|uniref:RNase H type-1 domain-containing protein n=1 Tax=Cuscuta europaea TaxID=41803 RepID=A0A9P1ELY7_CUSEU|nr:unnamed protein product [Cuscuta europaea]